MAGARSGAADTRIDALETAGVITEMPLPV
jgi:hypothetical protein